MSDAELVHRTYPARSGSAPHPALVLMHGVGSNEADMFALAPQTDPRLYVISLRAPYPYHGFGYSWYDLESEGVGVGPSMRASLDLLARFLGELPGAYPIDPDRIYLGGFSQGAAMTLATSLLHSRLVAGSIALSGYLPPDGPYNPQTAAGLPIFQAHGTHDQVVPIRAARQTRDFLEQTPVKLTYREYPIGHEVSIPELQQLATWLRALLDAGNSVSGREQGVAGQPM